jgi:hypothetical protein
MEKQTIYPRIIREFKDERDEEPLFYAKNKVITTS